MAQDQNRDQPLRILHVVRAPVGGIIRHILDVANGQIERGHHVGIVADSLTGQDAVNLARNFDERVGITGLVLTRMDGDGRGGLPDHQGHRPRHQGDARNRFAQ